MKYYDLLTNLSWDFFVSISFFQQNNILSFEIFYILYRVFDNSVNNFWAARAD